MNTVAPLRLQQRILDFCKAISPEQPVLLNVTPTPFSKVSECFQNVATQVEEKGGEVVHGWLIWDWPAVFTEAEFHAVWKSPDGTLHDITPAFDGDQKVVFLRDNSREFRDRRVDSIRVAASGNRIINDFIKLCEANHLRYGQVRNGATLEGREATLYDNFNKAKELMVQAITSGANRNAQCACGSGERYKRCHEEKIQDLISALIS